MEKEKEYALLAELERQTTSTRHTTFTALLSVSFVLPGLAVQSRREGGAEILGYDVCVSDVVFLLGYVFFLFSLFHYHWYHRHSHAYRKRLKELETELNISIYKLRQRPRKGPFKLHFEWALHIIGIVYGLITAIYIGWNLFLLGFGGIILAYVLRLLFSYWSPPEPLEK